MESLNQINEQCYGHDDWENIEENSINSSKIHPAEKKIKQVYDKTVILNAELLPVQVEAFKKRFEQKNKKPLEVVKIENNTISSAKIPLLTNRSKVYIAGHCLRMQSYLGRISYQSYADLLSKNIKECPSDAQKLKISLIGCRSALAGIIGPEKDCFAAALHKDLYNRGIDSVVVAREGYMFVNNSTQEHGINDLNSDLSYYLNINFNLSKLLNRKTKKELNDNSKVEFFTENGVQKRKNMTNNSIKVIDEFEDKIYSSTKQIVEPLYDTLKTLPKNKDIPNAHQLDKIKYIKTQSKLINALTNLINYKECIFLDSKKEKQVLSDISNILTLIASKYRSIDLTTEDVPEKLSFPEIKEYLKTIAATDLDKAPNSLFITGNQGIPGFAHNRDSHYQILESIKKDRDFVKKELNDFVNKIESHFLDDDSEFTMLEKDPNYEEPKNNTSFEFLEDDTNFQVIGGSKSGF